MLEGESKKFYVSLNGGGGEVENGQNPPNVMINECGPPYAIKLQLIDGTKNTEDD